MEKGLPLSMGRDYVCNLLQMGLSTEHNFWERGLERDQYYCLYSSLVDRSFTSFMLNSIFMILGRKDYDAFNSTIDYKTEADQMSIGGSALVCLSALEYSASQLWMGTDSGIFVLDPMSISAPFSVTNEMTLGYEGNAVRSLTFALGDVYAATKDGVYSLEDDGMGGFNITKNAGNGLPNETYTVQTMHNLLMAGTSDCFYYADSTTDPAYEIWLRASLVELDNAAPVVLSEPCTAMVVQNGMTFAIIGRHLFTTTTGKTWRRVYSFAQADEISTNALACFGEKLYAATNKGVYCDGGSARTEQVRMELCLLEPTSAASAALYVNDLWASESTALHAVGNFPYLYILRNDIWTKEVLGDALSGHKVILTGAGSKVVASNNQIWVE